MPLLPARNYESEHTRFIRELLERDPQLVTEQKKSRAIWWDKTPTQLEERRELDDGRVKMKPYVYGSE